MAIPYQAFVSTYVSSAAVAQSGFMTFSFANTAGFDAYVPITVLCPNTVNLSAGAEVTVFRTTDGGATWETEGVLGQAFQRPTINQTQRKDLYLGTGQYLVQVMSGGGTASTWSVHFGTAWVITAYA